ncbi:MAG: hypothetical protein JWM31_183 [Solirubrobacterales bacterium]|nr:hypothetical protein [Solirubrobacterales bacterium]
MWVPSRCAPPRGADSVDAMSPLVRSGLVELAVAALFGWLIVIRLERPAWLTRAGVKSPRRLMQAHLDYVMMGLIAMAVGLALPDLATWVRVLLILGTWVNPTLFLPLAFSDTADRNPVYRAVTVVSFVAMSTALVAAAVTGLTAD